MNADESTSRGAGGSRQAFSVIARIDRDDGLQAVPGRKVLLIVPRDLEGPGAPGAPFGGGSM